MLEVLDKIRQCRKCGTDIFHKGHERICNDCRKTNKCLDCGKSIEPVSKRCQSCRQKGKLNCHYGDTGELNPNYKDGRTNKKYFCKDCGDSISNTSAIYGEGRCGPCRYLNRNIYGKNNPNWKNGISKLGTRIRSLKVYKYWYQACLERDKHTCQNCGEIKTLEVHHKVSISEMIKKYEIKDSKQAKDEPEFWMLENGITYCLDCHCRFDKARWFLLKKKQEIV